MQQISRSVIVASVITAGLAAEGWIISAQESQGRAPNGIASEILDWNQIFIDTLIATNTANSSSPRLGAIVHTSIFDAYNAIDGRLTPVFVHTKAPRGVSRRAAVVGAAYTALAGLFPSAPVQATLQAHYDEAVAALSARCDGPRAPQGRQSCLTRTERGLAWGAEVAHAVLAWRAADGFSGTYAPFRGGEAVGQWRPTPPAFASMSSQAFAFTSMFVLESNTQFRPPSPRTLISSTYTDDFNAVKTLGRKTGSSRTVDQTALAPFWEGNASVHWNQAANQSARANRLSSPDTARLFALLNLAMADTVNTTFTAKRFYGSLPSEVTWRPLTAITLAETDGNPATAPDAMWEPLITTPAHPEYPAGHPSLNGAASRVLLMYFAPNQTFTLTTAGLPSRTYSSITDAREDGNAARVWGGMHYPSTVDISSAMGEAIADYVSAHAMR